MINDEFWYYQITTGYEREWAFDRVQLIATWHIKKSNNNEE